MHSSDSDYRFGDNFVRTDETMLIAAEDMLDCDLLEAELFDQLCGYRAEPMTVAETLLEVGLAGTGPEAIRLLDTLTGRAMSEAEALDVAAGWERQSRWLSARTQVANVAFVGATVATSRDGERAQTSRTLELALATDCNDTFLKTELATSRLLVTTLTGILAQLAAGELSDYRARRIADKLTGLPAEVAREIEARVLPTAGRIRLSSLLAKLRRLTLAARGPDAVSEHLQGVANRRVSIDTEPSEPGLLGLHAYLPAETTIAVRNALEAKAKEFAAADRKAAAAHRADQKAAAADGHVAPDDGQVATDGAEPVGRRNRDQRLADALAWFVLGPDADDPTQPARPQVVVQVTMSLPTLLHLRDHPAELAGYGPIPADIARLLAEDGDWQRFIHAPVTGYLLDVGDQTYVPPPRLRAFTQARDVTDRFPGSNRSARLGDADHVEPYDPNHPGHGGRTAAAGIACLSRIGHIAKTQSGWTVHGDANNSLTWTSPHGAVFTTTPHDYSDEPEPEQRRDPGEPPF